jgi:hypothetical protein
MAGRDAGHHRTSAPIRRKSTVLDALIEATNSSADTPKPVIIRNNTATGHGAGHSPAEYRRVILTEMTRTRAAENLLKFAMDRAGTAHRWRHRRPGLMR